MATTTVATALAAHDRQAIGWRADDHIRSGNRTTVDPLIGYRPAILPMRSCPRQPWERTTSGRLGGGSGRRRRLGAVLPNIRPARQEVAMLPRTCQHSSCRGRIDFDLDEATGLSEMRGKSPGRRASTILLGAILALLTPAAAASRDEILTVGGQNLHIEMFGESGPTVVFE